MKKHPDKHIQAALAYALSQGCIFAQAGDMLLAGCIVPLPGTKNI